MENTFQQPSHSEITPPKKSRLSNFRPLSFLLGLVVGVILVSLIGLLVLFLGIISLSEKQVAQVSVPAKETSEIPKNVEEGKQAEVLAYLKFKEIKESFIPKGIPALYGQELNISFNQVQDAINKVAPLDPTYGQKKMTLTGQDLERYIKIGSQIACEFCCGAKTLVFENGEAACGCDHSQMMRGLSAYLIKNHPQLSDEQILQELNLWKITYFPKQTLSKKLSEMEKAGEPGIKELLEEFPEFLPQMVGGC